MSYLRNGRELCEQGLYVRMEAYEYHAFLDFEEIRDDEFGTWGALCHRLNGGGVESIDEEVKQVRFASANDALRAFFAKALACATEPDADAQSMLPPLEPLLAAFLKAVVPQAKEKAQRAVLVAFGRQMCRALQGPAAVRAAETDGWLLLCAYLALHRLGELAGGEAADHVEALGLARPVLEAFQSAQAAGGSGQGALSSLERADLLRLMLTHENFLERCRDLGAEQGCAQLFDDPAGAGFLQLHESDGINWFNKERFELLLEWFALLSPFAAAPVEVAVPAEAAAPAEAGDEGKKRICALLVDSAAAAGYRLDVFAKLLADADAV